MMRILSGAEAPDGGTRTEGHQVVMQYFAQDEATRLDPTRTVYETLEAGSPIQMVPAIRTILGGFLFGGDDIYKKAGVLSGGERTRLAVARMLLRPANTLLLDEPTNHLDMDSKDVLLDALEDFGGTLILVSHDRYFIDKLATKIIDVGGGTAQVYPGGYEEYRWSLAKRAEEAAAKAAAPAKAAPAKAAPVKAAATAGQGRRRRKPTSGAAPRARRGRPSRGQGRRRTRRPQAAGSRGPAAQARAGSRREPDRRARGHHRRARGDDEDARSHDERRPASTRTTTRRSRSSTSTRR